MTQYRIHWVSKTTNRTGCGSQTFTKEAAELAISWMNRDKDNAYVYYAKPAENERQRYEREKPLQGDM